MKIYNQRMGLILSLIGFSGEECNSRSGPDAKWIKGLAGLQNSWLVMLASNLIQGLSSTGISICGRRG